MKKRKLGKSGLETAPLVFGGNVFGWTIDEKTSFKILDGFLDAGFDCIDTADVYSKWAPGNKGGESETILGNWLKNRRNRDKVIIATKVGSELGPGKKGLSKAYIFQAIEDSLKRLQTDYIDLYQSHLDDSQTPLEETLDAFAELIRAGKVKAIGASNYEGKRLAEAIEVSRRKNIPSYQSLQPLYNLYDREGYEKDLEPVCQKYGLGVIPYFSLASGFLTGKYRTEADLTKYARGSIVKKYLNDRGMKILGALDAVAKDKNCRQSSIALAWLLTRPSVTAPIVSATTREQVQELVKATEIVLDQRSLDLLNQASSW
jgi:aryl-alcohol dehydrogenase-like predicted oxidoreductase